LKDVGRITGGQLVEVQRSDLVAGFVGQTASKTKGKITEALGGVLFVDEAYRLAPRANNAFGAEAVDELMSVMDRGDPVMIFAGYRVEMQRFLDLNTGFRRRVRCTFDFVDYTPIQLAQIASVVIEEQGFKLNLGGSSLADLIRDKTDENQRKRMNGGLGQIVYANAKRRLDRRVSLRSDRKELSTFTLSDITLALGDIGPVGERGASLASPPPTKGGPTKQDLRCLYDRVCSAIRRLLVVDGISASRDGSASNPKPDAVEGGRVGTVAASLLNLPRGAGTVVKAGWKLREHFPGYGTFIAFTVSRFDTFEVLTSVVRTYVRLVRGARARTGQVAGGGFRCRVDADQQRRFDRGGRGRVHVYAEGV